MSAADRLPRSLGLSDALTLGLTAMIGAGVFSAFAPAAASAGSALLLALLLAAVIATLNALASAQLAVQYPSSGGTYVYGRERLGHWWGFLAGWGFVVGKSASAAAMAMTFAAYAVPAQWQRPVAAFAVLAIAILNSRGIQRTARTARLALVPVLLVLGVVVAAGITAGANDNGINPTRIFSWQPLNWYGILQGAGLLFFAFAGYARMATLAEEVREPESTLPRAIGGSLALVLMLYSVICVAGLSALGHLKLADSTAPLRDVVAAAGWNWAVPLVLFAATIASLGALLALLAGVSRTTFSMARNGDLPPALSQIHPRFGTPQRAELVLGCIIAVVVLLVDLRSAIGFSSFGVLLYYAIANAAAFTQEGIHRRYPRALQIVGVGLCLLLMLTLPLTSVLAGCAVLAVGVGYRLLSSAQTA